VANVSLLPCASGNQTSRESDEVQARYELLDKVLQQPVLKKYLFSSPVVIKTLELLEYNGSYLCRVRSEDGAEGLSVAHPTMATLFPIFLRSLRDFFIGQDARELDLILEKVYIYQFNFRYNGLALGLPLATIEFAILDMLGKMANKPMAELISEIHNPEIELYMATELRELPLEEHCTAQGRSGHRRCQRHEATSRLRSRRYEGHSLSRHSGQVRETRPDGSRALRR